MFVYKRTVLALRDSGGACTRSPGQMLRVLECTAKTDKSRATHSHANTRRHKLWWYYRIKKLKIGDRYSCTVHFMHVGVVCVIDLPSGVRCIEGFASLSSAAAAHYHCIYYIMYIILSCYIIWAYYYD